LKIKVVQTRSAIGRPQDQHQTLRGLGLTKIRKESVLDDTPAVRGMIRKVAHFVQWQEING